MLFRSGKKGEDKETDFIDIVAWRNTAEFVSKYFSKGRMVVVEGRLQIRQWTDKDGNKRRSAEVVADNIYFGDSKKSDSSSSGGESAPGYGGEGYGYSGDGGFEDLGDENGDGLPF